MTSKITAENFVSEMKLHGSEERAKQALRYFKTGKGMYGEGDLFAGLTNGQVHSLAKKYPDMTFVEIEKLLESPIHEARFAALTMMANTALKKKTSEETKKGLFELYLKRTDRINNWDLVDCSCRAIVGGYLLKKSRRILYKLAKSESLWERRIAIISTLQFIKEGDLDDTFKIADLLLNDSHDLIHKAVGWMLREAGMKDKQRLLDYLDKNVSIMPRTTLRYAIEKFDEHERKCYLEVKRKI